MMSRGEYLQLRAFVEQATGIERKFALERLRKAEVEFRAEGVDVESLTVSSRTAWWVVDLNGRLASKVKHHDRDCMHVRDRPGASPRHAR
jgi:hypothetical protein